MTHFLCPTCGQPVEIDDTLRGDKNRFECEYGHEVNIRVESCGAQPDEDDLVERVMERRAERSVIA